MDVKLRDAQAISTLGKKTGKKLRPRLDVIIISCCLEASRKVVEHDSTTQLRHGKHGFSAQSCHFKKLPHRPCRTWKAKTFVVLHIPSGKRLHSY
jgi:hypothetical protein